MAEKRPSPQRKKKSRIRKEKKEESPGEYRGSESKQRTNQDKGKAG